MTNSSAPDDLTAVQIEHESLLDQAMGDSSTIEMGAVHQLLRRLSELGTTVGSSSERDRLRSLIRYWSTFVNDKTGSYPAIQLLPYDGAIDASTSVSLNRNIHDRFGSYSLIDQIGGGGFSKVYVARHIDSSEDVAIKIFDRGRVKGDRVQAYFLDNEKLLETLEHPNILKIRETGTLNGTAYVVMDFIPDGSLADRRMHWYWRPKLKEIINILTQIATALEYLHDKGIVHRDIKPGNILLTQHNHVLVADFGLAQIIESFLGDNIVFGTPHYLAPESILHPDIVSDKVDIYSFGIVAYELLSGKLPFYGDSTEQILNAQIRQVPQFLTESTDVPYSLATLVNDSLSKSPEQRPSASQIIQHLRDIAEGLSEEELNSRAYSLVASPELRHQIPHASAHDTTRVVGQLDHNASQAIGWRGVRNRPTEYVAPARYDQAVTEMSDVPRLPLSPPALPSMKRNASHSWQSQGIFDLCLVLGGIAIGIGLTYISLVFSFR